MSAPTMCGLKTSQRPALGEEHKENAETQSSAKHLKQHSAQIMGPPPYVYDPVSCTFCSIFSIVHVASIIQSVVMHFLYTRSYIGYTSFNSTEALPILATKALAFE